MCIPLETGTEIFLYLMYCTLHYFDRVFTWGAGRFGQLGNGGQDDCSTLSDITNCIPPEMGRVVQVSASSAHTAVLTDKGMTFMFGDSRYDQLGW